MAEGEEASRPILPTVRNGHSAVTRDSIVCRASIIPHSLLIIFDCDCSSPIAASYSRGASSSRGTRVEVEQRESLAAPTETGPRSTGGSSGHEKEKGAGGA